MLTVQESAKCPPVEYVYDMELDLTDGETINETIEVDYEYSYDINVSNSFYYSNIISCWSNRKSKELGKYYKVYAIDTTGWTANTASI